MEYYSVCYLYVNVLESTVHLLSVVFVVSWVEELNLFLSVQVVCDCDSMPSRRIMEATNDQIWRVVVKSIDWSSSLPGEDKTTPSSCTLKQNVRPQIMTHFLQMYTADHTKTVRFSLNVSFQVKINLRFESILIKLNIISKYILMHLTLNF